MISLLYLYGISKIGVVFSSSFRCSIRSTSFLSGSRGSSLPFFAFSFIWELRFVRIEMRRRFTVPKPRKKRFLYLLAGSLRSRVVSVVLVKTVIVFERIVCSRYSTSFVKNTHLFTFMIRWTIIIGFEGTGSCSICCDGVYKHKATSSGKRDCAAPSTWPSLRHCHVRALGGIFAIQKTLACT